MCTIWFFNSYKRLYHSKQTSEYLWFWRDHYVDFPRSLARYRREGRSLHHSDTDQCCYTPTKSHKSYQFTSSSQTSKPFKSDRRFYLNLKAHLSLFRYILVAIFILITCNYTWYWLNLYFSLRGWKTVTGFNKVSQSMNKYPIAVAVWAVFCWNSCKRCAFMVVTNLLKKIKFF